MEQMFLWTTVADEQMIAGINEMGKQSLNLICSISLHSRDIEIYVADQQMHTDKVCFIIYY